MQKRAQAATDAVYQAYAKLYPEHVVGMPGPPRAIVIDDPALNAFALGDDVLDKDGNVISVWMFYFTRGLLTSSLKRAQCASRSWAL